MYLIPRDVVSNAVRAQYERYPYPPVPWLALPARDTGEALKFDYGRRLTAQSAAAAENARPRILIAGCGTLEPLVAASANPQAAEIVAVDFSAAALARLTKRLRYASAVARWSPTRRRSAGVPMRLVNDDLFTWEDGEFDYIIASNVLHHVEHPAQLLARFASWLRPGGLLRLVTYPRHSRMWIRYTRAWLELRGITADDPALVRRAKHAVDQLDSAHPIRSCYLSHGETRTSTGIVDAFMHRCENPLSPVEWAEAVSRSGLVLGAEAQHELSRSSFLHDLAPQTQSLDRWRCLQILDDLCELAASPVYWLVKQPQAGMPVNAAAICPRADKSLEIDDDVLSLQAGTSPESIDLGEVPRFFRLPSVMYGEMGAALRRARDALASVGADLDSVLDRLREEVGPRRQRRFPHRTLPGLTVNEYNRSALLRAPMPWGHDEWQRVQARFPTARIFWRGERVAGQSLVEQARHLQLEKGPFMAEFEIALVLP